jgi:DNA oxidative demethylase
VNTETPPGLRHIPDLLSPAEEAELIARLAQIEFSAVEMRGQVARRRTAHFGWVYGYESWRISPGPPVPGFLESMRARCAGLLAVEPNALAEVLVTEYPPGAGIGWHRDAPQFGPVVGVSLVSPCRMRFRTAEATGRQTRTVLLEPRSAYVLDGDVRWKWHHHIPPTRALRYSVTFRTLRRP